MSPPSTLAPTALRAGSSRSLSEPSCVLLRVPHLGDLHGPVDFGCAVHDEPDGMVLLEVQVRDDRVVALSVQAAIDDPEDRHSCSSRYGCFPICVASPAFRPYLASTQIALTALTRRMPRPRPLAPRWWTRRTAEREFGVACGAW